jgi:glucosamine--fructose-6-phosphate aminotransferase (isomerizing)
MLLLAMLSEALDPDPRLRRALTRVPEAVEEMLSREDEIAPLAGAVAERRLVILGRGYNLASACEIALKLKEISGAIAESESGAEFMHGPIAMVERDVTVMVVEAEGPSLSTLRDVAAGLRARGARVVRFSDAIDLHDGAASLFRMPAVLPEELTPIPFIVAGQLLATEVALARGRDPDHVAGLQKVTQTL